MENAKYAVVLFGTLVFYIVWAIRVGIKSNQIRAEYRADFKKEAEKHGCCVQAQRIKTKKRYEKIRNSGETSLDFEEYDKSIYEYMANGKKYRFTRNFDYGKSPSTITVWYQKSNPRKRVINCDDVFNKYGCLLMLAPTLLFALVLYALLTLLEKVGSL